MERRKVLQSIGITSAGLMALPAWAKGWNLQTLPPTPPVFHSLEQTTLTAIIEAIIPESDTLGAKSVGVPAFIEKMLADCYEKEVVENVEKGLLFVENTAASTQNTAFSALPITDRQTILLLIEKGENESLKEFYKLIKNLTIQGYTSSEYVQTTFLEYKMIPGYYDGCVPV